jgi:hypothetical protein
MTVAPGKSNVEEVPGADALACPLNKLMQININQSSRDIT